MSEGRCNNIEKSKDLKNLQGTGFNLEHTISASIRVFRIVSLILFPSGIICVLLRGIQLLLMGLIRRRLWVALSPMAFGFAVFFVTCLCILEYLCLTAFME